MRLFIRYLLACCFLLLGGYVLTCHNRICSAVRNDKAQVRKTASSTEKFSDSMAVTESEDDDESPSSRKYAKTATYCVTFFEQAPGRISCDAENHLPFCEHFSYSAPYKFIIHRVIRI
ncbi:hypothetical protein LX66_1938 [Chitinophaga japonensis]|uniref:Uncharacterized protein n=2 Tax=Chitinophaga japonensis TaxID=104662 RepID=A0A562T3M5_CHIJA|nr:hypothetical protein LX66_1938 [Chitinophaga japonensis]